MPQAPPLELDAVIFGGGAAGLWLLSELVDRGFAAILLEAGELGSGQTIASQGIIHGGLKYTLSGLLTPSATAIRDMPQLWRRCLAGERRPHLTRTRLRSEFCYLWRTSGLGGRVSMIGARMGLRIAPSLLSAEARPAALLECPGDVARLDEQVIEPESMLRDLADQQRGRVLKIDSNSGLEFVCRGPGEVELIRLLDPESGAPLDLRPGRVIFTAGAGNAALREMTGLDGRTMQRRPLHMVMVRGALPPLNGHCVDGASTRVTITSTVDCQDRVLWQIGGQLSELGATMSREQIIERAREEIAEVLPGIDVEGAAWASYCVDRAENRTASGRRPDSPAFSRAGNTVTGWPIKLALVPVLVQQIVEDLGTPAAGALRHDATALDRVQSWPHPAVALPPWERCPSWSCAP